MPGAPTQVVVPFSGRMNTGEKQIGVARNWSNDQKSSGGETQKGKRHH